MPSELLRFIHLAEERKIAIGHFNISDLTTLKGIVSGVRRINEQYHINLPVIIGTSEGEVDYLGYDNAVTMVKSFKKLGFNIFLNADHTHSIERLVEAVRAGYDSAVFDVSHLSFNENIGLTREAVRVAKSINPLFVVEGEIGHIGGASQILTEIPKDARYLPAELSRPEEAVRFVNETGVDLVTPAVGNIHGIMKDIPNPKLDIERIASIHSACSVPLVLHGGSGTRSEEFLEAIYAGMSVVHINTELRLAWRRGLEASLSHSPDESTPYKLFPTVEKAIESVVYERLKLFNKLV